MNDNKSPDPTPWYMDWLVRGGPHAAMARVVALGLVLAGGIAAPFIIAAQMGKEDTQEAPQPATAAPQIPQVKPAAPRGPQ